MLNPVPTLGVPGHWETESQVQSLTFWGHTLPLPPSLLHQLCLGAPSRAMASILRGPRGNTIQPRGLRVTERDRHCRDL